MRYGWQRFSIADAWQRIREGETPWVAIGDFLDDWYRSAVEDRLDLVRIADLTGGDVRWAAVCAACVEQLCIQDELPVPLWTKSPQYILATPWYFDAKTPMYRKWLEETSFPAFKARNIMAGDRVLLRA
jgi:hypothetical protein